MQTLSMFLYFFQNKGVGTLRWDYMMTSQMRGEGEFNLYKPKKNVVNLNWNQDGVKINHKHLTLTRFTMAWTCEGFIILSL
jgi:hypothetical protein